MTTDTAATRAADTLREKAERQRAAAPDRANADEMLRQADALQAIAGHVAIGLAGLRAALGPVGTAVPGITAADRERAGNEIYGLAQRRAEKGRKPGADAAAMAGWDSGDGGLPIHRSTLREAASLYELALALHYDSFWDYSRGLLHESMGEYAQAIDVFDHLSGQYVQFAADQAKRCHGKLAGTYNEQAEFDASLARQLDAGGTGRIGKWLLGKVFGKLSAAHARAVAAPARASATPPTPPRVDAAPLADADVELAERTAQAFAEHLSRGDFAAAHALLARDLRATSADDLRAQFEQMMDTGDDGEDPGEITVTVMSGADDMPDLRPDDLGWVYVAISNDIANEAVTVVVTREDGAARIRELEWGRP